MSNQGRPNHARLTFRLPTQLKETIEKAAVLTGQSVSGFAISTLARTARDVIEQESVTRLSNRDETSSSPCWTIRKSGLMKHRRPRP